MAKFFSITIIYFFEKDSNKLLSVKFDVYRTTLIFQIYFFIFFALYLLRQKLRLLIYLDSENNTSIKISQVIHPLSIKSDQILSNIVIQNV